MAIMFSCQRLRYGYTFRLIPLTQGKYAIVDHKNRNGLDNRKANLRVATRMQNTWNSINGINRGFSKYKGVRKHHNKWRAVIEYSGKKVHLGCFAGEIEAAGAYDAAARKYHGEFAVLNRDVFPLDFK